MSVQTINFTVGDNKYLLCKGLADALQENFGTLFTNRATTWYSATDHTLGTTEEVFTIAGSGRRLRFLALSTLYVGTYRDSTGAGATDGYERIYSIPASAGQNLDYGFALYRGKTDPNAFVLHLMRGDPKSIVRFTHMKEGAVWYLGGSPGSSAENPDIGTPGYNAAGLGKAWMGYALTQVDPNGKQALVKAMVSASGVSSFIPVTDAYIVRQNQVGTPRNMTVVTLGDRTFVTADRGASTAAPNDVILFEY